MTSAFETEFVTLTGFTPFLWQRRLFGCLVAGEIPSALDLPTGLGKTSVMAIWMLARAHGADLPRRLVYVVDRRAVVDQATDEAEKLRCALDGKAEHFDSLDKEALAQARTSAANLKRRLGLEPKQTLAISTLRGAHADNREWLADPSLPAIVVGTVDMIGSRLLFEGYGVSRKMRPYQAGLLGTDSLIVLDEAHLAPPFAHLLRAIEQEQAFHPISDEDRALLPRFAFLPLSATQRELQATEHGRAPFRLKEEDLQSDSRIRKRLTAPKALRIAPLEKQNPDKQLAEAAWALAEQDGKPHRIVVFCTRRDKRDKEDEGSGPSVQGVKEEIEKLANGGGKSGRAITSIHPPELLVGARRVWEREAAAQSLHNLGFIGEKCTLHKPAFVLATAAGEVGVDIDADHMVSDLVAWERMVQRLGRVNRRGVRDDTEVSVFTPAPAAESAEHLAKEAWLLARDGGRRIRCVLCCSEPAVAKKTKELLDKYAEPSRKQDPPKADIRLIDGDDEIDEWLASHGFLDPRHECKQPSFLIASSNASCAVPYADHIVSQPTSWADMANRLSRVAQRGLDGSGDFLVIAGTKLEKRLWKTRSLIEGLRAPDGRLDASSAAIRKVEDAARPGQVIAASTPEPFHPALSRATVDAWSMTSLEAHTGRPRVAPWLRGWEDDAPQSTIVWRTHLPVRLGSDGGESPADGRAIDEFFEAAPPHQTEKLETETYRIAAWLEARARMLLGRKTRSAEEASPEGPTIAGPNPAHDETLQHPEGQTPPDGAAEGEGAGPPEHDAEVLESENAAGEPSETATPNARSLRPDTVVALILKPDAEYSDQYYTLRKLGVERKGKARDAFESELQGKIVVLDQRFGGLESGLLADEPNCAPVPTADTLPEWNIISGFRVGRSAASPGEPSRAPDWFRASTLALRHDGNGDPVEWLLVEHLADAPQSENARSISRPQGLAEHQALARNTMLRIAKAVGLSDSTTDALACGAALHDEGKRAARWQRAFKAARDACRYGLALPLAKTHGPIDQQILGHYRHELGSVLCIERNPELIAGIPEEWRDLVLHLIAAHHGRARPLIEMRGCEDAPPSLLEAQAAVIALRFAMLQERWGPWGLAWWEALMRAADQQASRESDAGGGPTTEEPSE